MRLMYVVALNKKLLKIKALPHGEYGPEVLSAPE
jgi:hypothetical protein